MNGKEYDLGCWVGTQRASYHAGKLADDLVKKLNDIGFDWGNGSNKTKNYLEHWHKMFDYMDKYKQMNGGSFRIPDRYVS